MFTEAWIVDKFFKILSEITDKRFRNWVLFPLMISWNLRTLDKFLIDLTFRDATFIINNHRSSFTSDLLCGHLHNFLKSKQPEDSFSSTGPIPVGNGTELRYRLMWKWRELVSRIREKVYQIRWDMLPVFVHFKFSRLSEKLYSLSCKILEKSS